MEKSNKVVITDINLSFNSILKLVANVMLANLLIALGGVTIGFFILVFLGII